MSVKIALIGEAWGEKEAEVGAPFVGSSGYLLDQMLAHAGIARRECLVTNCFNLRPRPNNDIKNLCGPRTTAIADKPALMAGKYIRREYAPELERLYEEVRAADPNIISDSQRFRQAESMAIRAQTVAGYNTYAGTNYDNSLYGATASHTAVIITRGTKLPPRK